MTRTTTWALAAALAAILATSWHLDDHGDEQRQADELSAAQRQAAQDARREKAARAICAKHGEAGHRWAADGALICTTKHGRTLRGPDGRAIVAEVR